jgi:hypothetical protein
MREYAVEEDHADRKDICAARHCRRVEVENLIDRKGEQLVAPVLNVGVGKGEAGAVQGVPGAVGAEVDEGEGGGGARRADEERIVADVECSAGQGVVDEAVACSTASGEGG